MKSAEALTVLCRNQPYLASLGPEVAFLDRYTFIHKHTRGVSCTKDVMLCVLTPTGIPLEPCSQSRLLGGERANGLALRVRLALKTLYRAQQRPGSPSTHLLGFFEVGGATSHGTGSGSQDHAADSGPQEPFAALPTCSEPPHNIAADISDLGDGPESLTPAVRPDMRPATVAAAWELTVEEHADIDATLDELVLHVACDSTEEAQTATSGGNAVACPPHQAIAMHSSVDSLGLDEQAALDCVLDALVNDVLHECMSLHSDERPGLSASGVAAAGTRDANGVRDQCGPARELRRTVSRTSKEVDAVLLDIIAQI